MNRWSKNPEDLFPAPVGNIFNWLTKPYILSQALKCCCQNLSVRVLSEKFTDIDFDKSPLLFTNEVPLVRQVLLEGDNTPWTYGQVVIPLQTFERHSAKFTTLGTNLLGETLLYHNPLVTRGQFEYALLNAVDPLYHEIYQNLSQDILRETLYGRRSVFYIQEDPLLVSEFILPTIPLYSPM